MNTPCLACRRIVMHSRARMQSAYVGPCVVVSWVGSSVLPVLGGRSKERVVSLRQTSHTSGPSMQQSPAQPQERLQHVTANAALS